MSIFKVIRRIIAANRLNLGIYIAIPMFIVLVLIGQGDPVTTQFESRRQTIILFNEDPDGGLAAELEAWLGERHKLLDIPDDKNRIRDALFYEADALIRIPAGFSAAREARWEAEALGQGAAEDSGPELVLELGKRESYGPERLRLELDSWLGVWHTSSLARPGSSFAERRAAVGSILARETQVQIERFDVEPLGASIYLYFRYISYGLLASVYFMLAMIALEFNRQNIRLRSDSSPVPGQRLALRILGAGTLSALGVMAIYAIIGALYYGWRITQPQGLAMLLNILVYTIVCITLSQLLTSTLTSRQSELVYGVGNVMPLVFSFFGGVFLPFHFLSEPVQRVATILPSYWYVNTINVLEEANELDQSVWSTVARNNGVLLLFALVFILATLALRRATRTRHSVRSHIAGDRLA
ncbi:MAG: ABC transporter permease [Bacillota bacterium]|nr:ABC transporter permease [Bacillota bacterium]